ncbi:ABC transporter ATP-binding protein [Denitromonas ohlonensis]|nr:ABC transporter ATP-binding protein [Denitromonas ohlonensis]
MPQFDNAQPINQFMIRFSKLLKLVSPEQRRNASVLFGLMTIGTALELLGVGLVIPVMGILVGSQSDTPHPMVERLFVMVGNPTQPQLIVAAMLTLVAIYAVKNIYLAFLYRFQARFAFGIQADVSRRLFHRYLMQPYIFHLGRNSAQLVRNVTTEANLFASHAIMPSLMLVAEGSVSIALTVLLLFVEPIGTAVVGVALVAAAVAFFRFTRKRTAAWGKARQANEGARLQHLQQGLGGIKEAQLLGREHAFLARYETPNDACADAARNQETLKQMPRLAMELLSIAGLALLVVTMILRGTPMEAILPVIGVFAAAAFRLMPSVNRMLGAMQTLRYVTPVVDTMEAELALDWPQTEAGHTTYGAPGRPMGRIELRDIEFAYPDSETTALSGVSLHIDPGETIGIVGTSGSGKSTLIDVILGLLEPRKGVVTENTVDIRQALRPWQDRIGYVAQSIFLTDDSLRRNIAFGVPDERIDEDAVRSAIHAAQLDGFVSSLPQGLDTSVGERGVRLSGGQRQRIGIARALYHNPDVLVLDEATSALDNDTEADFMNVVSAMRGERTIIIVAHRLSTVQRADRIFRLESGQLVAEGTPDQVISSQERAS